MNTDRSFFHVISSFGRHGLGVLDRLVDRDELIQDIGSLQIENVVRVFEFNPAESWARDVTAEILEASLLWRERDGREWNESLADDARLAGLAKVA